MANSDIQTALDAIKRNLPHRQRFIDYYDGRHELAFATEKFRTAFGETLKRMRDNLCPIIVDAVADRMEVINFAGDEEGTENQVSTAAWKLWQRDRMELLSNETHVEALKTGCAYVIAWPGDDGKARFFLQDSRNCVVIEDEETGDPVFGAKQWETMDEQVRFNLYYADRIEQYITPKKKAEYGEIKATSFILESPPIENPYGVMPMFYFEAKPVLSDAMPLQDGLNKTLCDMMVVCEYAAYPQRWATGLEPPMDELTGAQRALFSKGADRLWFVNDGDVKFGQFDSANMDSYLKQANEFRTEIARVSGTPAYYFGLSTSDAMSGEALKVLESRFTKKAARLCLNFGAVWAKVMKLALAIERMQTADNLTVQWSSPEQRSEKEFIETLLLKMDLGVPAEILFEEYGYTPEDIKKFDKMTEATPDEDPAVTKARAMQNGG